MRRKAALNARYGAVRRSAAFSRPVDVPGVPDGAGRVIPCVPCIRLMMTLAALLMASVMKSRTTATPKSAW